MIDPTYHGQRHFKPLIAPRMKQPHAVMHIAVYLEDTASGIGKSNSHSGAAHRPPDAALNFETLRYHMNDLINRQPISKLKNFRLEIVLSVNGYLQQLAHVDWLRSLDGFTSKSGRISVQVFQRANVGYQWGGFWDVWNRLEWQYEKTPRWWITAEQDTTFTNPYWYDQCVELFKQYESTPQDKPLCWVGCRMGVKLNAEHIKFLNCPLPFGIYVDANGNPTRDFPVEWLQHSGGGAFFCDRAFLRVMDKQLGQFTYAMGCNHALDGIVSGEVGFSHKAQALGYRYIAVPDLIHGLPDERMRAEAAMARAKAMGQS